MPSTVLSFERTWSGKSRETRSCLPTCSNSCSRSTARPPVSRRLLRASRVFVASSPGTTSTAEIPSSSSLASTKPGNTASSTRFPSLLTTYMTVIARPSKISGSPTRWCLTRPSARTTASLPGVCGAWLTCPTCRQETPARRQPARGSSLAFKPSSCRALILTATAGGAPLSAPTSGSTCSLPQSASILRSSAAARNSSS